MFANEASAAPRRGRVGAKALLDLKNSKDLWLRMHPHSESRRQRRVGVHVKLC
jgi:hypothetical protein